MEILLIERGSVHHVDAGAFRKLENLKRLSISWTQLQSLDYCIFEVLPR